MTTLLRIKSELREDEETLFLNLIGDSEAIEAIETLLKVSVTNPDNPKEKAKKPKN